MTQLSLFSFIILTFIIGIVTLRSTLLGIVFLIISSCTFGFVSDLFSYALGTGTFSVIDIVVFIVFLKTLFTIKIDSKDKFSLLILSLIFWIILTSLMSFTAGLISIREVYRSIFKIALFWILPITLKYMSSNEKKNILYIMILVSIIVSLVQNYAFILKNFELLALIQPPDQTQSYGFSVGSNYYRYLFLAGEFPRLYIAGHILIKAVFALLFIFSFLKFKFTLRLLTYLMLLISASSIILLGGISDILFIIFIVISSYFLVYKFIIKYKIIGINKINFVKILTLFIIILALTSTYLPEINKYFIERYILKTTPTALENTRLKDTEEALEKLVASPISGIGSTKVYWQAQFITYGGQDVHPFISFALLCGFPGLILLLGIIFKTVKEFKNKLKDSSAHIYSIAAGVSFFGLIFISVINSTPVFFFASVQVPLGLLLGFAISNNFEKSNENINVFSK